MEVILGILAFTVAALAVLQGWQMRQDRRNRHNPTISDQLGGVITQLERIEQRLNDIWDKVK